LDPSSHLGSSNLELSFLALFIYLFIFVAYEPLDFLSKMMAYRFRLDLPLFGLGPWSKGHGSKGPIYDSHPIGLFYFIWPSSKVTFKIYDIFLHIEKIKSQMM